MTTDYRIEVSTRLREHFQNGRSYYPLHGQNVAVPQRLNERPDPELLRWHNEVKFLSA